MHKKLLRLQKNCISILLFVALSISGCGKESGQEIEELSETQQEEQLQKKEQKEEESAVISFGEIKKEEFVQNLKELNLKKNELLICTDREYNNSIIVRLNQLLEEQDYPFRVKFCKIPEEYLYDGAIVEFADYLKEQNANIDVIPFWNNDYRRAVEHELLYDFSGYMESETGLELRNAVSEKFWELTMDDGKYYGIGNVYAPGQMGWSANLSLMEKYGYSSEELSKPLWELEDIFANIKKNEPTAIPFILSCSVIPERLPVCYANYPDLPIGIWRDNISDSPQIQNLFETEEMEKWAATANDFYQKGYLAENGADFLMQLDTCGMYSRRKDNMVPMLTDSDISRIRIPYYDKFTTDLTLHINTVPAWSPKKEDALSFLSFLFRNQEASELLLYGVEGEDYEVKDGKCNANENFNEASFYDKCFGNWNICRPLVPYEDEDRMEADSAGLQEVKDSPLFGFNFDESSVRQEADAVRELYCNIDNIRNLFMFAPSAETGSARTWQEYYTYFQNELKNAGIDKIVDEMNRQFQDYLKK